MHRKLSALFLGTVRSIVGSLLVAGTLCWLGLMTAYAQPVISFVDNGNGTVSFAFEGTLQAAPTVTGPYSDVGGLSSSVTVPADQAMQFFRCFKEGTYSREILGYINKNIPTGVSVITNPLNKGGNKVSEIFGKNLATTVTLYSYGNGAFSINSYHSDIQEWDNPDQVLSPGQGFIVRNRGSGVNVTFVGEVPQGDLSNTLPRGFSIRSSQVPQAGKLGVDLGFPTDEAVMVYHFGATGYSVSAYDKDFEEWEGTADWRGGPVVGVAEGFWVLRNSATNWKRSVRINDDSAIYPSGSSPEIVVDMCPNGKGGVNFTNLFPTKKGIFGPNGSRINGGWAQLYAGKTNGNLSPVGSPVAIYEDKGTLPKQEKFGYFSGGFVCVDFRGEGFFQVKAWQDADSFEKSLIRGESNVFKLTPGDLTASPPQIPVDLTQVNPFGLGLEPFRLTRANDSDGDGLSDEWEAGTLRYQVIEGSFSWHEAKVDAEKRGGHLVTITSQKEQDDVFDLVKPAGDFFWIGATDEENEGNWEWVTGEQLSYTAWLEGEPNNFSNQDYAALGKGWSWWRDLSDNTMFKYILEFGFPTDPNNPDTDDDKIDDGIEYSDSTNPLDPNDPLILIPLLDGKTVHGSVITIFDNGQFSIKTLYGIGEVVLYSTDGSDPAEDGELYEGPFQIGHGSRVRAVALDQNFNKIDELEEIKVNVLSLLEKEYTEPWTYVELKPQVNTPQSVTILYTLDGRAPISNGRIVGKPYSEPIEILSSSTLKAVAFIGDLEKYDLEIKPVKLMAEQLPTYAIKISQKGKGTVIIDPAQERYLERNNVKITATASPGWDFLGWTGNHQGKQREFTLAVVRNYNLTAVFDEPVSTEISQPWTYLSLASSDTEAEIKYTTDGRNPIEFGIIYNGKTIWFKNPGVLRTITYPEDLNNLETARDVIITVKPSYTLEVLAADGGDVYIDNVKGKYLAGDKINIRAMPKPGWQFIEWSNLSERERTDLTVLLTIDANIQTRAVFGTKPTFNVTGKGRIQVHPELDLYPHGTEISVMAVPDEGRYFLSWAGAFSGATGTMNYLVKEPNPNFKALFVKLPEGKVSLSVLVSGKGRVIIEPRRAVFDVGEQVSITAEPMEGATFKGYSGYSDSSQSTINLDLTGNAWVLATFTDPGNGNETENNVNVPPTIINISPSSGAAGAKVIILGENFTEITDVTFNAKSTPFNVVSENKIEAFVLPGTSTGLVSISNPHGVATSPVVFKVESGTDKGLNISIQRGSQGTVVITFKSPDDGHVIIQSTDNFEFWEEVGTLLLTDGNATLSLLGGSSRKFYRAVKTQSP